VDRGDAGVGEIGVGVVSGDLRVIPGRDLAVEDLGDHVGAEVEVVDALEVEDDRDRADVRRDLDRVLTAATLLRAVELALLGAERRVGAGEHVGTGDEVLPTGAGADRVVVDGHAAVGALEAGSPSGLGALLGGRTAAVERAAEAVAAGGAAAVAVIVRGTARGKGDRENGDAGHDGPAERSASHFEAPVGLLVFSVASKLGSRGGRIRGRR
jgi:hypothetical protein